MEAKKILKILMLLFSLIVIFLSISAYLNSLVCMKYETVSTEDIDSFILYEEIILTFGIVSSLYFLSAIFLKKK